MNEIHKEYARAFLLEPTKLTRLVDKMHERLGDQPNTTTHDSFEVFLSGNRQQVMTSVDQVLALENSRRQRIKRLLITCSATTKGALRPEHEIQLDFGKTVASTNRNTKVVEITVRSAAAGWASRTLSEVEEQVERTWLRVVTPLVTLLALLVCMLIVFASQFVTFEPNASDAMQRMWLRGPDIDRVEQILSSSNTITEEEMREITTRQLRTVLEEQRPKQSPQNKRTRQVMFLGIPLLVLLACVITLGTCYPTAVFLWGDEVKRYDAIVQRRKTFWNIVIGIIVVGVSVRCLFLWLAPGT